MKFKSNSLKYQFLFIGLSFLLLIGLLASIIRQLDATSEELEAATEVHYQSYKLADQLRQSSDELTRLVRTHVVTGDPLYKNYFSDVLKIRDGEIPRPEGYHSIFWDFILSERSELAKQGTPKSLLSMMREIGFTKEEFLKIEEAKKNSDALVSLETEAMNALLGIYKDQQGFYSIRKDPDPIFAQKLVHGKLYHSEKAKIMKPIQDFYTLLETRTSSEITRNQEAEKDLIYYAIFIIICAFVIFLFAIIQYVRKIQVPIHNLTVGALAVENGNNDTEVAISQFDEIGLLTHQFNQMVLKMNGTLAKNKIEIQERKQIEVSLLAKQTELDLLNSSLEKRVEDRTKAANDAAKAKTDFLANMSHEIRTPLNAIIGFNSLLESTTMTREQEDYVDNTNLASSSLLSLINDILDFSKIEAGMLTLEKESFDLNNTFEILSSILSNKSYEKRLELIFNLHPDTPRNLIGDSVRLNQVLINLCNNALKFTEDGEIELSVDVVSQNNDEVELLFSVKDSGIGISKEAQRTLFESFTQADNSTTRKYGGTGLGLSISSRLCILMGGTLEVKSELGEGCDFYFTVTLPIDKKTSNWGNISRQDIHVLLVDDNVIHQQVIHKILTSQGVRVEVVSSGEEAIEISKSNNFDVILMDMVMPGLNGVDTSKRLKNSLDLVPVIIMISGMSALEVGKQINEAGIASFLQKPITPVTLIQSINDQLLGQGRQLLDTTPKNAVNPFGYSGNGQKVLLVEDNALNQIVAKGLLEKIDIQVTVAENGSEALRSLKESQYDLILMDIQMPVMGGYDATEQIRFSDKKTPIIAMTANALPGDRARAIEAGMNDYISKPIDTERFFETLAKWIQLDQQDSDSSMQTQSLNEGKLLDYAEVCERVMGDEEIAQEILVEFNNTSNDAIQKIKDAHEAQDVNELNYAIHTLKGAVGNVSIHRLFQILKDAEVQIRSDGDVSAMIQEAEEMIETVRIEIEQIIQGT
ncbi:MAG: response regulator [Alteromonadales bacterium]|nr:response regulator [Alteromonadales bacterium]